MTPEFLIRALSIQDIPPLENMNDKATLHEICQKLLDPLLELLKAQKQILDPDQSTTTEEISALGLKIGAQLCDSLLPAFADRLVTADSRPAKVVFDDLKLREFEDAALEDLVCGLVQALEPSFLAQNSEEEEYSSDCSSDNESDEGEEEREKENDVGRQ